MQFAPQAGLVEQELGRAMLLLRAQRIGEAEAAVDNALRADAKHFGARNLLGYIRIAQGRPHEAVALIGAALKQAPRAPDAPRAHFTLAGALKQIGRLDDALAHYEKATARKPDFVEAHYNLANSLLVLGRFSAAVDRYEQVLKYAPDLVDAHLNISSALRMVSRFDEALAHCDQALALRPESPAAHYNRGCILRKLLRHDEALVEARRAIALNPDHPQSNYLLANCLGTLGRYREALPWYAAAMRLAPNYAEPHCDYALVRLILGEYEIGWPEFEWRWHAREEWRMMRRTFAEPVWRGEPIEGKTILLHTEQGLGDALHFARFVPMVAALGAKVLLEVGKPLVPLLANFTSVSAIFAQGDTLPKFDCHCSVMSLAGRFNTTLDTIPGRAPYLQADAEKVGKWRPVVSERRIGLVWAGNPNHRDDHNRSIAVERLRPLLDRFAGDIVVLQRDLRDADRALLQKYDVLTPGEKLKSFADTAAIVDCLDVVVSVDTSVAHLAAGMGKPTWIMLPLVPDWRWMLEREDCVWYPTVRLFRQRERAAWEDVVHRIMAALDERLGRRTG